MSWMTSGFAGPGQQHSFDAILKAGTSNIFYVRPEEDVTIDLDLHVYDENGTLVAYDDHVDMDAACRVTPRWTGPFRIVVSSAQGSSRFALLIKTLNN